MSVEPTTLRERKKMQRCANVQRTALVLFQKHGYPAVTINQIAEASGISPATFFRYFPTKEDVVLFDALDLVLMESGEPPEKLEPIQAILWLYETALSRLSPEETVQQELRFALIRSVPELRARLADEIVNQASLLAAFLAKRVGKKPADATVQTLAGAVVGVLLTGLFSEPSKPGFGPVVRTQLLTLQSLINKEKI